MPFRARRSVLCLAVILLSSACSRRSKPEPAPPRLLLSIPPSDRATITAFSVSPDGSRIAFPLSRDGVTSLWLRPLDSGTAHTIPGTEGASAREPPVWSPDSLQLLFFAGGQLKKLAAGGGIPEVLCDADENGGAAWSKSGVIVFTPRGQGALHRIPATGGTSTKLRDVRAGSGEFGLRRPFFLPDGRHFFYIAVKRPAEKSLVYVGSLEHSESKSLLASASDVQYVAPPSGSIGSLLSLRDSTLLARSFDQTNLRIVDDPVPVAEPVGADFLANRGQFSVATTGLLAFSDSLLRRNQLVWVDAGGKRLGTLGQPGYYNAVNISPDGLTALVSLRERLTSDLWAFRLASGLATRLTFGQGAESNRMPVWSRDGRRIAWVNTAADGTHYLMTRPFNSSASPTSVWATNSDFPSPLDWSPDGRHLLLYFYPQEKAKHAGLWTLAPYAGGKGGELQPAITAPNAELVDGGAFSPDGRSTAFGGPALFLQPFPPGGAPRQLTPSPAARPRWSPDGRAIYFWSPSTNQLMSVDVRSSASKPLFPVSFSRSAVTLPYDISPDGRRFLLIEPLDDPTGTPISVLLNWRKSP
jgi:eukaryotic-like serine/threonine-protein kinase